MTGVDHAALAAAVREAGRVRPPARAAWPNLTARYDAAYAYLDSAAPAPVEHEDPRVRTMLANAFAAGSLWQYDRDREVVEPAEPVLTVVPRPAALTWEEVRALPVGAVIRHQPEGPASVWRQRARGRWVHESTGRHRTGRRLFDTGSLFLVSE